MIKGLLLLFSPFHVCVYLFIIGCGALWLKKAQKIGKVVVTITLLFLLIISNGFISQNLLRKLEYKYPPLGPERLSSISPEGIEYIVILGASSNDSARSPVTSWLGATMLNRLTEGLRLHNKFQRSILILSGGSTSPKRTDAELMYEMALDLGIDRDKLMMEDRSKNTYEQAHFSADRLAGKNFFLVTSAVHMPRAMAFFRRAGLDPIPAPTDHHVSEQTTFKVRDFLPSVDHLVFTSSAVYEYSALLKAKFLGWI